MAPHGNKVTVDLDAQIVDRARRAGCRQGERRRSVERALNAYLLGRLLDATQRETGLSDDDSEGLA